MVACLAAYAVAIIGALVAVSRPRSMEVFVPLCGFVSLAASLLACVFVSHLALAMPSLPIMAALVALPRGPEEARL